ncbi:vWA domain-containing protein, partial [Pseudomonas aeruginosa]
MLLNLFNEMRAAKVPVSVRELLDLIDALKHRVVFADMDEFYYLARTIMVKDERHFDKFDRAFGAYFKGLEKLDDHLKALIPEEWLRKEFERLLTDEEKAQIQSLGGLDKLIEEFKKRLEEQKERHAGGNKWIGTGGTSPFGSGGFNPEGVRVGDAGKRQGKAAKVWDQREYKNLDDQVELGTRNIKIALRRLRKFAREGAAEELDIDGTIDHTAKDAGLLNIQMRPERRNTVKLLLLLDIGGSMDAHVKVCEELFSACKTEFKHLEYFSWIPHRVVVGVGKRESEANQPSRNRPAGHWLSACWREGIRIVRERGAGGGALLGGPLADTAQSRWRCQGGP